MVRKEMNVEDKIAGLEVKIGGLNLEIQERISDLKTEIAKLRAIN